MRPFAVLAALTIATGALLSVGPPVGVFSGNFAGGPAERAGAAAEEKPLRIWAEPVEVPADAPTGLEPAGAWVLRADNEWFGGLSGLLVEGDRLTALTDKAHLLRARFAVRNGELAFADAVLWHLRDAADDLLDKDGGDGESLARVHGRPLVAFERDHRIQRLDGAGRLRDWAASDEFADLPYNGGIEAMAGLRDGRALALAEEPSAGRTLWWLISADGTMIDRGGFAFPPPHHVTGAALGPDGRLYLAFRDFSIADGIGARIGRLALEDGRPAAGSFELLAEFTESSGIDNMEGIAVSDGWLWLVSDDNFNPGQRTLLMRFRILE